jgi:hypothetical protein
MSATSDLDRGLVNARHHGSVILSVISKRPGKSVASVRALVVGYRQRLNPILPCACIFILSDPGPLVQTCPLHTTAMSMAEFLPKAKGHSRVSRCQRELLVDAVQAAVLERPWFAGGMTAAAPGLFSGAHAQVTVWAWLTVGRRRGGSSEGGLGDMMTLTTNCFSTGFRKSKNRQFLRSGSSHPRGDQEASGFSRTLSKLGLSRLCS